MVLIVPKKTSPPGKNTLPTVRFSIQSGEGSGRGFGKPNRGTVLRDRGDTVAVHVPVGEGIDVDSEVGLGAYLKVDL